MEDLFAHAREGQLIFAEGLLDPDDNLAEFSRDDLELIIGELISLQHKKIKHVIITMEMNSALNTYKVDTLVRRDSFNISGQKTVFNNREESDNVAEFILETKPRAVQKLVKFLYEYLDIPHEFRNLEEIKELSDEASNNRTDESGRSVAHPTG